MIKKIGILALLVTLVASTTVATVMACTRTPGYWKNHPEAWPDDFMIDVYDQDDLMDVLWTPVRGNVATNLAQKVIALQLSIDTWGSSTYADGLMADAYDWLLDNYPGPVRPNTPEGQEGLALAADIDDLLNLYDVD
jgi:hypothetical protein